MKICLHGIIIMGSILLMFTQLFVNTMKDDQLFIRMNLVVPSMIID